MVRTTGAVGAKASCIAGANLAGECATWQTVQCLKSLTGSLGCEWSACAQNTNPISRIQTSTGQPLAERMLPEAFCFDRTMCLEHRPELAEV
jgi:hypothetical protein